MVKQFCLCCAILLLFLLTTDYAFAEIVYKDDSYPGGIPDFRQEGGVCIKVATANCLWYWDHHGYSGLFRHLFGDPGFWQWDGQYVIKRLEALTKKYGGSNAFERALAEYIRQRGKHWIPGERDGLRVRLYSGNKATYSLFKQELSRCQDVIPALWAHKAGHSENAWLLGWRHGQTGAGWDNSTPPTRVVTTNGWRNNRGQRKADNDVVVSRSNYEICTIKDPAMNGDKLRITSTPTKGIPPKGSDYIEMVRMYTICPLNKDGTARAFTSATQPKADKASMVEYSYCLKNYTDSSFANEPVSVIGISIDVPFSFYSLNVQSPDGWTAQEWIPNNTPGLAPPEPFFDPEDTNAIDTGGANWRGVLWTTDYYPVLPGESLCGFSFELPDLYDITDDGSYTAMNSTVEDSSRILDVGFTVGPVGQSPVLPFKSYFPTTMVTPPRWAPNYGSTQDSLLFDNVGTGTLYVQVSGPSWTSINPYAFSIPEDGPTQKVNLTFNGYPPDTIRVDSLRVVSNHGLTGGGQIYSDTNYVPIHFVVSDYFAYPEYDTASYYSPRTTISSVGNLGNMEDSCGMFYNGHNYLYDFSPVLVTLDVWGEGPVGFTWLGGNQDFLPASCGSWSYPQCPNLQSVKYSNLKLEAFYSRGFSPIYSGRHTLHPDLHNWWSYWSVYSRIVPVTPQVLLVKNWWIYTPPPPWWPDVYPNNPAPGYFGIAADWDVPSEAFSTNNGDYDDTKNLIWLRADTSGFSNHYAGFLFLGASATNWWGGTDHYTQPFGAHILDNATQLNFYGGYDDDSLYKYMSTPGFSIESDSSQDKNIVMSFVEKLDPDQNTVIEMDYALLVSNQGYTAFRNLATKIKNAKNGDANVDGNVTVSDVVYLINYLFKGGPEPWFAYSDVNADGKISVVDVVYLISYLFKGGQPPKTPIWMQETPPW
ncbi:MAG: dockerin type I domain-containing protein [candidate division Zixibacteria bacterium]|nr:dockerin type I domain-containing protein [candidate division Zixibacteria bacterium]